MLRAASAYTVEVKARISSACSWPRRNDPISALPFVPHSQTELFGQSCNGSHPLALLLAMVFVGARPLYAVQSSLGLFSFPTFLVSCLSLMLRTVSHPDSSCIVNCAASHATSSLSVGHVCKRRQPAQPRGLSSSQLQSQRASHRWCRKGPLPASLSALFPQDSHLSFHHLPSISRPRIPPSSSPSQNPHQHHRSLPAYSLSHLTFCFRTSALKR